MISKQQYITSRNDMMKCLSIYCHLKNINPSNQDIVTVLTFIVWKDVIRWLDLHFKLTIITKNNELIKVY